MDKENFLITQLNSKYIGDDGAVIDDMIYSMDAFFEGVHFKREWMSMSQIARKAMLVNISDAVAMNASPKYALTTVAIPYDMSEDEIVELTKGLQDTADEFGFEIIGGDTIGGNSLNISITLISQSDAPLYRKNLRVDDILLYTGELGESKRDLDRLFAGKKIKESSKFYEPILRGEFISKARRYLRVGMDISDGLYCDTNKLLEYNSLGFESLAHIPEEIGMSGEEYEMLIAVSPENLDSVMEIAKGLNVPLTIFGKASDNQERYPCHSHHF
ncbi:Thiamine-monophosphate kinase [hydrothermal vent metagenome]|uniref:Thiamine-monophosphate kinase n=1 Tax=hydrothermal vent metagenome TaxID=652676 RepID=A0A1W1BWW3_9ZZZZ